jgi:hypothetical protein
MKRIVTGIALVLAFAATVHAQAPLTGKWQETTTSGLEIGLDLVATETALTGTFTIKGRPHAITDGTVSKNTFTFKANLGQEPEGFTGELAGDQITLNRDRNGKVDPVTLKRVQSPPAITGKWQGETKNGSQILLNLTATGTALTGTLTRNGETTPLADGKVLNETFTFKATLSDHTEGFTGEPQGDAITVWMDRQGRPGAVILNRVRN